MFKKALALTLAVLTLFISVSCGKGEQKNANSSATANKEQSSLVSEETSSAKSSSQKTSSQKVSSVQKENVSSEKETATSSKKGVDRTENTSSKTESEAVKIDVSKRIEFGAYQLNPFWTKYHGDSEDARYEEFETVLDNGYFNSVIVGPEYITDDRFWDVCVKRDITVWVNYFSYFDSTKKTIDEYLEKYCRDLDELKTHPERWKLFNGFHYEEQVWRGQTNADFLLETKTLYQKYGKRNFVVLATGEFTEIEGNEVITGDTAEAKQKLLPYAMQYLTDVSFDSYTVDVREGTDYSAYVPKWQKRVSEKIVDGKTYYIEHIEMLLRLVNRPVNVWFFPTAYTCWLACGLNGIKYADQGFCVAHMKFFSELLEQYDYKGGIYMYTYPAAKNSTDVYGMQKYLSIRDENGSQYLYPDHPKWYEYSKLLKQLTAEYNSREVDILWTAEP